MGDRCDIKVAPNTKQNAIDISWGCNQTAELRDLREGTTILRTSHTDWDLDTILKTYWPLTEIEANFRSLKSELGSRPIYHHKTDRTAGHQFIAVSAR